MTTTATTTGATEPSTDNLATKTASLRRMYFARFGFAIVWAVAFAIASSSVGTAALVLAVLYPVFDLACVAIDARSGTPASRPTALYLNVALSLGAAIALGIVGSDAEGLLVVWGIWAVTAGLAQLAVGVARRTLGGQLPMILSGGISVLAGGSFIAMAPDATSVRSIAGYATLGGIFFLVSALRLGRR